ncbi:MAG: MotA/TolQ/ExbB proton channel family protein [Kiritimatiellaeota bacterium]|nr:MotA/TolQ/ExbB proton channel family protein [Kiritimatiellota bacterium]
MSRSFSTAWFAAAFRPCRAALIVTLAVVAAPTSVAAITEPGTPPPDAVDDAVATVRKDIAAATRELAEFNRRTADERLPLVRGNRRLQHENSQLRDKLSRARRAAESTRTAVAEARKEIAMFEENVRFIDNLTAEYRRAFETRISPGAALLYGPDLKKLDDILRQGAPSDRVQALPPLLELIKKHADARLGGVRFPGRALTTVGEAVTGKFVEVGPLSFFAETADPGEAGVALSRPGSSLPTIFASFPPDQATGIRELARTGKGTVPVDVTAGAALKLQEARESWWQHVKKGGVIMVPILGLAVVCAVLAIVKLISLHFLAVGRADNRIQAIVEALERGDPTRAMDLAQALHKPLGPVICEGIEHRDAPKEQMEEMMYERLLAQVPALERFLSPLAVGASTAPLLGLLGTVTGMIHTFRLITVFGTGDARVLSAGISEALITTEYGLMIAVPALLVHAYLSRRVRRAVALTQQAATMFVNSLKFP